MDSDHIVADLHAHTTVSDGVMSLAEVPATARDAGLDWVAVTDHDRIHPDLSAPVEGTATASDSFGESNSGSTPASSGLTCSDTRSNTPTRSTPRSSGSRPTASNARPRSSTESRIG